MSEMWYSITAATLQDIVDAIRYVRGISGYIPIDKLAEAYAGKNVGTAEEVPLAERNCIKLQTLVDLADLVRAKEGTTGKIRVSALAARIRGQQEDDDEVLKCTHYGASIKPETYDSAFISSLTEHIGSSKLSKFTVNADGSDEYIYYCVPVSGDGFGQSKFSVNGFFGGFILEGTVSFTSSIGKYPEKYYIYRSENSGLGDTAVIVE